MIKGNELRLGNLIYDTRTVGDRHGLPTLFNQKAVKKIEYDCDYDYLEPIPLTEQIAYNFGLKKHENSNEYWNHFVADNGWRISQALHTQPEAGVREGYFYYGESYLEVEFAHELQNLFFALCKKELIYNQTP